MHASGGFESQDEVPNMKDEGGKYGAHEMKVRGYGGDYSNNLHAAWNLIKHSKVLPETKLTIHR